MKTAYRKDTGAFVDNEESDRRSGLGYNIANLEAQGLTPDDVVVVDAKKEDVPWDKMLVDGKLVPDTEKLAAKAAHEQAAQDEKDDKAAALASVQNKLKALGLTPAEIEALRG